MKIDGACHCGAIRYEAEVDPESVVICHCTDCQTLSGTAFRTLVGTLEGSFKLLSGQPTLYVKTGESGNRRALAFCPTCGTSLYSGPQGDGPKVVALRVGTIRQRDQLTPRDQFWHRSAQAWLRDLNAIRHHETQPRFEVTGRFGRRD
jgi:hypothetical protein